MARGMAEANFYESRNVDEHVDVIGKYVVKSLRDPESVKLARKLVTGRFDFRKDPRSGENVAVVEAWGKFYRAPPGPACKARDGECEITRIWDFLVLNLRYTFDPQETDTFSTLKESLESGGGDCLPEGTKILKRSGLVPIEVPIESIKVGDWIYDGTSWTRVLHHWDKGVLPTLDFLLSNGSTLRCTPDHRVFEGQHGQEVRAGDLQLEDDLLQPTGSLPGWVHLSRAAGARVKHIFEGPESHVYDFQTESGRIYLPEQDIIVHNCDDATIAFAVLLKAIGFKVVARVISTTGKNWEHIYALVGLPHDPPTKWVSLDCTVEGHHPGSEFRPYKTKRDFLL